MGESPRTARRTPFTCARTRAGATVTQSPAQDFCYAWRRLQEPSLGSEYAYIMHMVRYAQAYNTHAAQAAALRGSIQAAVAELLQKYPGPIPAPAVLAFSAKQNLDATLKGTQNEVLRNFLLRPAGDLPRAELSALPVQFELEGKRRALLYEEAKRHFGIDGGAYAKDDHTLVVELLAPTPYFLELTSFYPLSPVPSWAIEKSSGRNWFLPDRIVANGPFRLSEWRVGDHIRLERSESYWGQSDVKLRDMDVLPIENATTALNLYLTGEVDWLPQQSVPQESRAGSATAPGLLHRPRVHLLLLSDQLHAKAVRRRPRAQGAQPGDRPRADHARRAAPGSIARHLPRAAWNSRLQAARNGDPLRRRAGTEAAGRGRLPWRPRLPQVRDFVQHARVPQEGGRGLGRSAAP